jgi:hypothetical protein
MLRLLLRLFLLLMTLVGIGLAFVMPWAVENQERVESGRWRVYDAQAGFRDVMLDIPETPQQSLVLDISTRGPVPANQTGAITAVTASKDGRTLFAQAISLQGLRERLVAPQAAEVIYTVPLASLGGEFSGQVYFRFTRGDAELDRVIAMDLIQTTPTFAPDPRLLPIGYMLLVVGFVGLVTSFRSRAPVEKTEPPPPRWGR